MITLYRARTDDPSRLEYWEIWQSEPRLLTLHKGEVGDIGLTAQVKVRWPRSAEKALAEELAQAREEGYEPLASEPSSLVLQFPMDPEAEPEADLARLTAAEELCEEILGWTGNGRCDGHDIGAGALTIFAETVHPLDAVAALAAPLAESGVTGLVAAVPTEAGLVVIWPESRAGDRL